MHPHERRRHACRQSEVGAEPFAPPAGRDDFFDRGQFLPDGGGIAGHPLHRRPNRLDVRFGQLSPNDGGDVARFGSLVVIGHEKAPRATAKANGTKFGREPKLTPHRVKQIIRRIDAGESEIAMARTFAVNEATISRLVNLP